MGRGLWGQTCKLSKSCTFHQLGAQVYASISPGYTHANMCNAQTHTQHTFTHTEATATRNTRSACLVSKAKSASAFVVYCVFPPKLFIMFSSSFRLSFVWLFPLPFRLFLVVALHAAIPISLARAFKLRCPIGNLLQIHLNQ